MVVAVTVAIIIMIMEICLIKALNKHSITHIMYMEMLSVTNMDVRKKEKANT